MNIGKQIRLNRIFSHPSGRLCSVAVDHFIGYGKLQPGGGLANLPDALKRVTAGGPCAVTMSKGTAMNCWAPYAGKFPLIIQSGLFTGDDRVIEYVTTPAECVRLGADAIAVAIGIFGPQEGRFIKILAEAVAQAAEFDLPVIAHIYPRDYSGAVPKIVFEPEGILWAARVGLEAGADVIKAGARGATIGRNIWGVKKTASWIRNHNPHTPRRYLSVTAPSLALLTSSAYFASTPRV